ncbi:hypothetical protein ABZ615_03140, partial [Streptomyces sp. NPDC007325]|uniref:hypothetical protein n=1 Tax=Streptomyces sp. NPDC007325 TaxID=3154588 RepID=UPI0033F0EE62
DENGPGAPGTRDPRCVRTASPARSCPILGPAGEGRTRPGRPEPATPEEPEPTATPSRDRTATESAAADRLPEADPGLPEEDTGVPGTEAADRPEAAPASRPGTAPQLSLRTDGTTSDQPVPLLTLGVGLTLMGLGLGFLGLRLRRR